MAKQYAARVYEKFQKDRLGVHAAAFAYYSLFSIGPMLLIAMLLIGFFARSDALREKYLLFFAGIFGSGSESVLATILGNMQENFSSVWGVAAIIILVFSAARAFVVIQTALNKIFGVRQKNGLLATLKSGLFSTLFEIALVFLLLLAFALNSFLSYFDKVALGLLGVPRAGIAVAYYTAVMALLSVFFAIGYRVIPSCRVPWRSACLGGILAGALFVIGNYAFRIMTNTLAPSTLYGAAGGIVLVMLWAYYTAIIFFLGAELSAIAQPR